MGSPQMEELINNDLLIEEIEIRAPLYDKSSKQYTDINFKTKMWDEICKKVFISVWDNLSREQRILARRLLQGRWKNIRACFLRELREQKLVKAGLTSKQKRRKYIYYNKLLFLLPNVKTRGSNVNIVDIERESDDTEEEDEGIKRQLLTPVPHTYNNKRSYEERFLEIVHKEEDTVITPTPTISRNKKCYEEREVEGKDQETHFALSLVPMLKSLPDHEKLNVQIQILQILKNTIYPTNS